MRRERPPTPSIARPSQISCSCSVLVFNENDLTFHRIRRQRGKSIVFYVDTRRAVLFARGSPSTFQEEQDGLQGSSGWGWRTPTGLLMSHQTRLPSYPPTIKMGGRRAAAAATAAFLFGTASMMREGVMLFGPLGYAMLRDVFRAAFFSSAEIHGTLLPRLFLIPRSGSRS